MTIKKHNTFCLVMIVKNESKVIERCLSSVKDIIDYWVICDTGSTDGTQDIIKNYFEKHNIKGELHEHVWRDFGYNRSLSCKLAKGHCDYLITLDADEVFKYDEGFEMPELTLDGYMIWTNNNGTVYQRLQVVNDKFNWYYEGILHEHFACEEDIYKCTIGYIDGMVNYPSQDGGRSADKNKYKRDALILEQGLLDEPDNSRYVYYLAQSYKDCGDLDNAIKNYKRRIEMKGKHPEEVYMSYYMIGLCKLRRNEPFENFVGDFILAYNYRSTRLEAVHKIVRYCRLNNMSGLVYNMFKHILERKTLKCDDGLFVEKSVYDYQLLDELSMAAYWSHNYRDAAKIIQRILDEKTYPKEEENRLLQHLSICEMKISNNNNNNQINWSQINTDNMEQIFTEIYRKNVWGHHLQRHKFTSGIASVEDTTREYRKVLNLFFNKNEIKTILDVGCGLWEFEHKEFDNLKYIGVDCVAEVINFNRENYREDENRKFITMDILDENIEIGEYNLCLIKDVLTNLSNKNIIKLLQKVLVKCKYVILVHDNLENGEVKDIHNGLYRPLNFDQEPLKQFEPYKLGTYWNKDILLIGDKSFKNLTQDDFKDDNEIQVRKTDLSLKKLERSEEKNINMQVIKKVENNSSKKISIVMAYYNRKSQLEYTLKTIQMSKFKNIEIIIVDDASREEHRLEGIINNYDIDIKLIRVNPEDKTYVNPCMAYNRGFKEATGDIIVIQNPEVCHIGDVLSYINDNLEDGKYFSFTCAGLAKEEYNPILYRLYQDMDDINKVRNYLGELEKIHPQTQQISEFWYVHKVHRKEGFHFLSAITKNDLAKIGGGFDERYAHGCCRDDDGLVLVIRHMGINVEIIDDVLSVHQYHEHEDIIFNPEYLERNRLIYLDHIKELEKEKYIEMNREKKNDKKISIVMAYYNRKSQLEYTLKTIQMSKFKNIEIIIVDDASREEHRLEGIINNYDVDIKLIRVNPEDKTYVNPCMAYNRGFKEATGDIIVIQNPEVCHIGDVLSYVNDNLEDGKYFSFTCSGLAKEEYNPILYRLYQDLDDINKVRNYLGELERIHTHTRQNFPFWYTHKLYRTNGFHFLSAITKNDLAKIGGGFDERYAQGTCWDDDGFVHVIRHKGIQIDIIEKVFSIHQYHDHDEKSYNPELSERNRLIYIEHMKELSEL
jgi:glycosyltransferase involved in cell wall biosynthesis